MTDNNPYHALVIGLVDAGQEVIVDGKNANEDGFYSVVVNLGRQNEVSPGQKVLVFSKGPELADPVSNESLGAFEQIKGLGRVEHVQEKMCTVRSLRTVTASRPKRGVNALMLGINGPEYETYEKSAPFRNVAVGDYVRFV